MDLQQSIIKAFFVAAFFGLTFTQPDALRIAAPYDAGLVLVDTSSSSPSPASSPAAPEATPVVRGGGCDGGMILVEGDYCPDAEQSCVKWIDPPPYQNLRCAEYAKPAKCKVGSPGTELEFAL